MNTKQKSDSVTLEILEAIEQSSEVTQRHLAQRLGVALGLANSYLKRCVRKGLIKVKQAPANRYLYYLTPMGFSEKSRLTAEYLKYSLSFYRRASDSVVELYTDLRAARQQRVVLCGVSDLAEIALLRASEFGLSVVAVHDPAATEHSWSGRVVRETLPDRALFDVCVVTDLRDPRGTWERLIRQLDAVRVRMPGVLGTPTPSSAGEVDEDVDEGEATARVTLPG